MLTTDAYAFLDIDHPLCAWATYRGALVCAPESPGFVSVWTAGLIRASDPARFSLELAIEHVRQAKFPKRVSRLRGMFCFLDANDAQLTQSWGGHFRAEHLVELSLAEAGERRDRLDANWITYAPCDSAGHLIDRRWIESYWAGISYPNETPVWETLVDGRLTVLGTEIRNRAYAAIKSEFPDSLMFLEIARLAAWVGSDLGSLAAFIRRDGDEQVLSYVMNMVDAKEPKLLGKLKALMESGYPVNRADMERHIEQESFGCVPDLLPYGRRWLLEQERD